MATFPHKKDKLRRASTVPDVDHAATLTSNHQTRLFGSGSGYLGCDQTYAKMAAATKRNLEDCDMNITALLDVNWWCCWNGSHMVIKFVQRVFPAASAKFASVIGCVVAIRPLARFEGPCTAECLRCAHPPSPNPALCLHVRPRMIHHCRWMLIAKSLMYFF